MNTPEKQLSESLLAACKAAGIEKPKYIAQDKSGFVFYYKVKPNMLKCEWLHDDNEDEFGVLNHPPYAEDWKESLLEWVEPQGEPLADVLARHPEHVADTSKIFMNELIDKTRQWFHDKGIIANSNPLKQLEKTQEELTETRDAVVRYEHLKTLDVDDIEDLLIEQYEEIKDGIGDTVVTLIGVCEMYGFTLEECLQMAYDTISKRNGTMIDGIFVKSK
jgi:NTP pyrophosphatase (non-canonical NTP hydrolase)